MIVHSLLNRRFSDCSCDRRRQACRKRSNPGPSQRGGCNRLGGCPCCTWCSSGACGFVAHAAAHAHGRAGALPPPPVLWALCQLARLRARHRGQQATTTSKASKPSTAAASETVRMETMRAVETVATVAAAREVTAGELREVWW